MTQVALATASCLSLSWTYVKICEVKYVQVVFAHRGLSVSTWPRILEYVTYFVVVFAHLSRVSKSGFFCGGPECDYMSRVLESPWNILHQ